MANNKYLEMYSTMLHADVSRLQMLRPPRHLVGWSDSEEMHQQSLGVNQPQMPLLKSCMRVYIIISPYFSVKRVRLRGMTQPMFDLCSMSRKKGSVPVCFPATDFSRESTELERRTESRPMDSLVVYRSKLHTYCMYIYIYKQTYLWIVYVI